MTGINMARVLVGGIVAGLVINIGEFILNMFVLRTEMDAMVARLQLPPIGGQQIGVFTVLVFALGIGTVWLYAAIRPRFGAGVRTALCAGAAVWFFAYLYPTIASVVMGMFSAGTATIAVVWGLVEVPAGAAVGAWLYQEQGVPGVARV